MPKIIDTKKINMVTKKSNDHNDPIKKKLRSNAQPTFAKIQTIMETDR